MFLTVIFFISKIAEQFYKIWYGRKGEVDIKLRNELYFDAELELHFLKICLPYKI
jgi:hypothetical protein